jgi:hypothetical protein
VFWDHSTQIQFYELTAGVNFQTCQTAKFQPRFNHPLASWCWHLSSVDWPPDWRAFEAHANLLSLDTIRWIESAARRTLHTLSAPTWRRAETHRVQHLDLVLD